MAVQGHPRSLILVTSRKRVCNFLLVIDSNLGPILLRFTGIACFLLRTATPPLFDTNFGCSSWTRSPMLRFREDPKLIIPIIIFEVIQLI